MDMKETLRYLVLPEDMDESGTMPAWIIAQKVCLAGTLRNKAEGGGRERLLERFKATWMFRRIRFSQYAPIHAGDELVGFGSGRTPCGNEYALRGELYRDGVLVAAMDMMMMPVVLRGRRRLTCEDTEPLYRTPPLNEVPGFDRLPMLEDMNYDGSREITKEDCDQNAGHFAFYQYIILVEHARGFVSGGGPLFATLQIDYVKECLMGDTIKLGMVPNGAGFTVQGRHANGHPCFNAYFELAE